MMRHCSSTTNIWLLPSFLIFTAFSFSFCQIIRPAPGFDGDTICRSCTTVKNGLYKQTDNSGTTILTFDCTSSSVNQFYCNHPGEGGINTLSPNPQHSCQAFQYPVVCSDRLQLTLWGDSRSSPCFIEKGNLAGFSGIRAADRSGLARDWSGSDYEILAGDSDHFPTNPNEIRGCGHPNVYSYAGGDIFHTLAHFHLVRLPKPGTINDFTSPLSYDSLPPYRFSGVGTLLLYFGTNSCSRYNSIFGTTVNQGWREMHLMLYTYLTTHSGIETTLIPNSVISSVELVGYTSAEEKAVIKNFEDSFDCSGSACLQNIRTGVQPTGPYFTVAEEDNYHGDNIHLQFNYIAPASGLTTGFPGVLSSNPKAVAIVYSNFGTTVGSLISNPFLFVPILNIGGTRAYGIVQFVEHSSDGSFWYPLESSFTPPMSIAYGRGDYAEILKASYSDHICNRAGNLDYCYLLATPPSGNKFLRIVSILSAGPYTKHATNSQTNGLGIWAFRFVPVVMTSTGISQNSLVVVPSMHPTIDCQARMGYDVCTDVPGCRFIPSTYGKYYPSDGVDSLHGSLTVKKYMSAEVLSSIIPCKNYMPDPLQAFLDNPGVVARNCYRFSSSPNTAQCATTSVVPYQGSTTKVYTDLAGTYVEYQKSGFSMNFTIASKLGDYVNPDIIIGPFDINNRAASIFRYKVPVAGSWHYDGSYYSYVEHCTSGTFAGHITQSSTCTCSVHYLGVNRCLCTDIKFFRMVNNITNEYSFGRFGKFSLKRIPLTMKSKVFHEAFDLAIETGVAVDCSLFLCAGNPQCLSYMAQSAYGEFCDNYGRILTQTLGTLSSSRDEYLDVFNTLTKNHAVEPATAPPFTVTQPQSFGPQTKFSASPAETSVRTLTTNIATLQPPPIGHSGIVSYGGYNIRNPLISPGRATTWAIFTMFGVGYLTEAVNFLALNQQILIDATANGFRAVASGFSNIYNIATQQANAHNSLVQDVNQLASAQSQTNNVFFNQLNTLVSRFTGLELRVSMLDLVGARSSTLVGRMSSIHSLASRRAALISDFKQKVSICMSEEKASALFCAGVKGVLLSTTLREVGTVHVASFLVLVPDEYVNKFVVTEFCYQNTQYFARPGFYFFINGSSVASTASEIFHPVPISGVNAYILNSCNDPDLILTDSTPGVPLVPIINDFVPPTPMPFPTLAPLQPLPTSNSFVHIESDLAALNVSINNLNSIADSLQGSDPLLLTPASTIIMAIAALVFAITAFAACAVMIAIYYCKSSDEQQKEVFKFLKENPEAAASIGKAVAL